VEGAEDSAPHFLHIKPSAFKSANEDAAENRESSATQIQIAYSMSLRKLMNETVYIS
jgi:hypothetical protein